MTELPYTLQYFSNLCFCTNSCPAGHGLLRPAELVVAKALPDWQCQYLHALFLDHDTASCSTPRSTQAVRYYGLLGRVTAKALQDGRLLDLPLSPVFYRLALGGHVDLYDIRKFDAALGECCLAFLLASSFFSCCVALGTSVKNLHPAYQRGQLALSCVARHTVF